MKFDLSTVTACLGAEVRALNFEKKFFHQPNEMLLLNTLSHASLPTSHFIFTPYPAGCPPPPTKNLYSGREYYKGKYHCTIDLLFDWFGLVCFANKNNNSVVIQLIPNQSNRSSTVQ